MSRPAPAPLLTGHEVHKARLPGRPWRARGYERKGRLRRCELLRGRRQGRGTGGSRSQSLMVRRRGGPGRQRERLCVGGCKQRLPRSRTLCRGRQRERERAIRSLCKPGAGRSGDGQRAGRIRRWGGRGQGAEELEVERGEGHLCSSVAGCVSCEWALSGRGGAWSYRGSSSHALVLLQAQPLSPAPTTGLPSHLVLQAQPRAPVAVRLEDGVELGLRDGVACGGAGDKRQRGVGGITERLPGGRRRHREEAAASSPPPLTGSVDGPLAHGAVVARPVLHDVRGHLDEVQRAARACRQAGSGGRGARLSVRAAASDPLTVQVLELRAAQHRVHGVAELVEERLHLRRQAEEVDGGYRTLLSLPLPPRTSAKWSGVSRPCAAEGAAMLAVRTTTGSW